VEHHTWRGESRDFNLFATAVRAAVFTEGERLATQVAVGPDEGLEHASWVMCVNLVSLPKAALTGHVRSLGAAKLLALQAALRAALALG
jgi:mRNA-degrading endonuclease toxin of MazEF toxin-antitoxin module